MNDDNVLLAGADALARYQVMLLSGSHCALCGREYDGRAEEDPRYVGGGTATDSQSVHATCWEGFTRLCERLGLDWRAAAEREFAARQKEIRNMTESEVDAMMTAAVLTPEHPRWPEFIDRLAGPEGCDFRQDEKGNYSWKCAGGSDQSLSRAILESMGGLDVEGSLAYFSVHGGHCDCEVIFNVNPDEDEEE